MDALRGGIVNAIFAGIYLLLFVRTLNGDFTIGTMVMLIQLINMARQPVMMMSYLVDTAQRAVAGSRDYFHVMGLEPQARTSAQLHAAAATNSGAVADTVTTAVSECRHRAEELRQRGDPIVAFRDVSFSYDADKPVLRNVSFEAHANQKVALVGESGGGKSTIVNLLLGFYSPTEGDLEVLGHSVADISVRNCGLPRLWCLGCGTVLALSPRILPMEIPKPARKKLWPLQSRRMRTASFAPSPKAITPLSESAAETLRWSKTAIAIARAILKDAPLLILDEATSALDTKAEREVQHGLEKLMEGRTTIIIAHRLSTISDVDTIVTLNHGEVDEIGAPAELARTGGIYAELLRLTASASAADRRRLKEYGISG